MNRTNLLHVENGIKEADIRIVQLDANKTDLSVANKLVRSVVLDADTGILTVTLLNGTSKIKPPVELVVGDLVNSEPRSTILHPAAIMLTEIS